ncbi:hypothetical protein HIM_00694 [Hirsutella minnesotensis 3608]|nr:hypothetical protein HIM_00694 [Hirsutella minnesotensis 3608]
MNSSGLQLFLGSRPFGNPEGPLNEKQRLFAYHESGHDGKDPCQGLSVNVMAVHTGSLPWRKDRDGCLWPGCQGDEKRATGSTECLLLLGGLDGPRGIHRQHTPSA